MAVRPRGARECFGHRRGAVVVEMDGEMGSQDGDNHGESPAQDAAKEGPNAEAYGGADCGGDS